MNASTLIACSLLAASTAHASPESDSRKVEEAFVAGVNQPGADEGARAILDLFSDGAQHIGIFGRVTKNDLAKIVPASRRQARAQKLVIASHSAIALPGALLVSITHFDYDLTGPDGKTQHLKLRCTRSLKKLGDGTYRIVAEHTSIGAPAPQP